MTVALARRLVWEGVVSPEESSRALALHVRDRVPFLRALVQQTPALLTRLEGELGHGRTTLPPPVIPDASLVAKLPPGLVQTLLAVPVTKDPVTGVVRVLVADGSDPHLERELSYHLGQPVEVVVAPLRVLLDAVRTPSEPPSERGPGRTPAFGFRAVEARVSRPAPRADAAPQPHSDSAGRQSAPPIPLVRVSSDVPAPPATVKGVAPQATGASYASGVVVPKRTNTPAVEPVIQLTRTKSLAPSPPSSPESSPPQTLSGPVASPREAPSSSLETSLRELSTAESAEDVVTVLLRGLAPVAKRALVLAVRGKVFEGRDATDAALRDAVRALVVSGDRPSVLLTAAQTGEYAGPMPQTLVHQELFRLLGEPADDIAVGSVTVSGRAALLYVAAGLDTAYLATRRGARLAEAAGKALERIVRDRKK